jgi:2-polyprenyl-3-methyl-5-hydroxy-6-metoxy-1,4-benzoquinol methylase
MREPLDHGHMTQTTEQQVPITIAPVAFDQTRADAFVGRVLGDTVGLATTAMASLGDRLGLFKDLYAHGASTSSEIAERTGTQERYVREWLRAMANADYLEYEPATGRYVLPPEHAPVLAQEAGPVFFGGVHEEFVGLLAPFEQLLERVRSGGGLRLEDYPDSMYAGIDRFTAGWFENLLIQQWLPLVPHVEEKLRAGARLADVGCGRGRALIKLAQAFPESRFVGYDVYEPNVEAATAAVRAAGLDDRIVIRQADASRGLAGRFDVITTFDVVHDAVDPRGMLRSIREALETDGSYLCLEINCSEKPEDNRGPIGALLQGCSVLLCLTLSLADHGEGLGTLGLPEVALRKLGLAAGFGAVRRVPLDNPFNALYELTPGAA